MIFSTHFKFSIGLISVLAVALLIIFLRIASRVRAELPKNPWASATIFKKNDREAIAYNSNTHMLTIQTSSGTVREYTRNPVIHIQKDGTVKVNRKLFNLEINPFIGVGYSRQFNTYVGLDLINVCRLDSGVALAYSPGTTRLLFSVGYNVWRNSSINVGLDNTKGPHVFVSVHF